MKAPASANPPKLIGERCADSTPDLDTRPERTNLFPPAEAMRRIGDETGLSIGRRKPSAWETVLGPIGGRLRSVSAVNAAGLTCTFFRREAISIGGGGLLKGFDAGGGGGELSSDSAISWNLMGGVDALMFSGL